MSREAVLKKLEELKLIDCNQITQAFVSMCDTACESDGNFRVCDLHLAGVSPRFDADHVTVKVSLDGKLVKTTAVDIVTGDVKNYHLNLSAEQVGDFIGRTAECSVVVVDKYHRELTSTIGSVQFGDVRKTPVVTVSAELPDTLRLKSDDIGTTVLNGVIGTDLDAIISVNLFAGDNLLWHSNILALIEDPSPFSVFVNRSDLTEGTTRLTLRATSNGEVACELTKDVEIIFESEPQLEPQPEPTSVPSKDEKPVIIGDVVVPDFVDVHAVENDAVHIGTLVLRKTGSDTDVFINVELGGNTILVSRVRLFSEYKEIELSVPFTSIARKDTYVAELSARVVDDEQEFVLQKILPLRVRSKYDLNLESLVINTAQFVNPRNEAVERLVRNSNGPLANAMDGGYSVYGYQGKGRFVVRQFRAVYDMFCHMKVKYVSDTFTFDTTKSHFQYVVTPDRVLSDCSGNCLELSIAFASILEAMGLEPVIAFPPGHAVVGVVLGTDLYRSVAEYTQDEEIPYVTMEVDGHHADVMFLETTVCPLKYDFVDAVCEAYNIVMDNIDRVSDETKGVVFVRKMRNCGVDPIVGM